MVPVLNVCLKILHNFCNLLMKIGLLSRSKHVKKASTIK